MGKEIEPPNETRQSTQTIYEDTKLPPITTTKVILPPLQFEFLNNPSHSRAKSQEFTFSRGNETEQKNKASLKNILCATPTNNKPPPASISPLATTSYKNDHSLPSINLLLPNQITKQFRDRSTAPVYKLSTTLAHVYYSIFV